MKDSLDDLENKELFLKRLESNQELLKMLSIERLKRLKKYYSKIIKQKEEEIVKLESNM